MKLLEDIGLITELSQAQRGVFSTQDLQIALAERHTRAFARRIDALLEAGALRRFSRGWYVSESFDLPTLSQRLAPLSYISFETVLAENLLIGPRPTNQITAVKVGRNRDYEGAGVRVRHLSIARHLFFGFEMRDGVLFAEPEKAWLDVLYFHLRGRNSLFDIYSDIDLSRLNGDRLTEYLHRFPNPKFVAFARNVLETAVVA